jgi:hypothetical protein
MLDDVRAMPKGFKLSMAKGIMGYIIGQDEVAFVE